RFTWPTSARMGQLHSLQPASNRGGGRSLTVLTEQPGLDLLGAPMFVTLTCARNPFDPLAAHSQRHPVRPAGKVAQITPAALGETAKPLVSRFAADAEDSTP